MVEKYTLGDLIVAAREDKEISQKALCRGLCSQQTMSSIEMWETKPKRLLLNALVQRLGMSPENFITLVTDSELEYSKWQQKVFYAVKQKDKERLSNLLAEEIAGDRSGNTRLQEQFYTYMKGYGEGNTAQMREALTITMPELKKGISHIECIGTGAMELLLMYLEECLVQERTGEEEIRQCLAHMEKHFSNEERVKIYPKAVLLLCEKGNISVHERLNYCKKAVALLQEEMRILEMPVLMEQLAKDMAEIGMPEAEGYQNYVWAFQNVYKDCGLDYQNNFSTGATGYQEMHSLGTVLRVSRIENGLSRETLSDGVFDVFTMGRIERGEQGIHGRNYQKLREKLDLSYEDIHSAKLVTNNYKCIQVGEEIQHKILHHEYEGLKEKLLWLRENLDLSIKKNRQYVEMEENTLADCLGEISHVEYRKRGREILGITIPKWNEEYKVHYYTGTEMILVGQQMVAYLEMKEYEKCLGLFDVIWKEVDLQENSILMRPKEMIFLLYGKMNALYGLRRDEEALETAETLLEIALRTGFGDKLDAYLSIKGRILKRNPAIRERYQDEFLHYYKLDYYMCDIFRRLDNKEVARSILLKYDIIV